MVCAREHYQFKIELIRAKAMGFYCEFYFTPCVHCGRNFYLFIFCLFEWRFIVFDTTLWNNIYHLENVSMKFSSIHFNMIAWMANYFVLRFPKCNHKRTDNREMYFSERKMGRKMVVWYATHQPIAFEIRCSNKIVAFTTYLWIISSKKQKKRKKKYAESRRY